MDFTEYLCPVCGAPTKKEFEPCRECRRDIQGHGFRCCSRCAMDLAGADDPCPQCRKLCTDDVLEGLYALGPWNGVLREWLSSLKYGGDARMACYPGRLLADRMAEVAPGGVLVPVPPRPVKVHRDGSDPVGRLAREMRRAGIPVAHLLVRRGQTAQKTLSRQERLNAGSLDYRMRRSVRQVPERCVLLDDVATTGATLRFCASVLRKAGVEHVIGLVVCRD